jgi:hypothetical protein
MMLKKHSNRGEPSYVTQNGSMLRIDWKKLEELKKRKQIPNLSLSHELQKFS